MASARGRGLLFADQSGSTAQSFTLPVYRGIGAPVGAPIADRPQQQASPAEEEPEDALLRLLRIPSDARIAFVSCVATWFPNGCFVLLLLAQARHPALYLKGL